MMNQLFGTSHLFGGNAPFVEELYENYLDNPASVPGEWRDYFDKLAQLPGTVARDVPHCRWCTPSPNRRRTADTKAAVTACGRQEAGQRPADDQCLPGRAGRALGESRSVEAPPAPEAERTRAVVLRPATPTSTRRSTPARSGRSPQPTFGQILDALKETYCGWVGVEYMYINNITERRWVQARIEPIHSKGTYTAGQKLRLLERLTAAETLERHLHTRYVGQKRFSLEAANR